MFKRSFWLMGILLAVAIPTTPSLALAVRHSSPAGLALRRSDLPRDFKEYRPHLISNSQAPGWTG